MQELVIDTTSAEPPFEQVRRQIASGASDGSLPPGHKLATVRQLATDLGLAANTVARAYKELEADGVVETHGRNGTFIAGRQPTSPDVRAAAQAYVQAARTQGLSKDEAIRLIIDTW